MSIETTSNFVIFAAGVGSRLGRDVPKFITTVLDRPLCDWTLPQIAALGGRITIVCGHRADRVVQCVTRWHDAAKPPGRTCQFVYNGDYRGPQSLSILSALRCIDRTVPTYFIDGDLIMSTKVLRSMMDPHRSVALVRVELTSDPVLTHYDGDALRAFSRPPVPPQSDGNREWANIIRYQPREMERLYAIAQRRSLNHHYEMINQCVDEGATFKLVSGELDEIDNEVDLQNVERKLSGGTMPPRDCDG